MPRVLIAPAATTGSDAVHIQHLLAAADCCCGIEISPLASLGSKQPSNYDVLVIIVGCSVFSPIDEQGIDAWVKAGDSLIAVWCSKPTQPIPQVASNFARALVRQDAGELAEAICREKPVWVEPGGEPQPERKTKRNKC